MERYKKKKVKKSLKVISITLVLVILLAVLVLFVVPQFLYSRNSDSDVESLEQNTESQIVESEIQTSVPEEESTLVTEKGLVFPMVLDDGRLELESVFPFSGINPDADKQEASDVAAVILKNTSDEYLKTAAVKTVFSDGSEQIFEVNDLPAGKSAMAFAVDNHKMSASDVCVDILVEAVFEEVKKIDSVSASIDGITLTLKNVSEEDLSGIDVYCRDVFNDKYFGGVSYKYTIEKLSAGESTTVTVTDCILGVADVVRIVVNNKK